MRKKMKKKMKIKKKHQIFDQKQDTSIGQIFTDAYLLKTKRKEDFEHST